MLVYKSYDPNNKIESMYRIVYDSIEFRVYLENGDGCFIASDELAEYIIGDTPQHTHGYIDSVYFVESCGLV